MFYFALIALKLLAFPLSLLPRPIFLLFGRALGGILLRRGFRVKIAKQNIELAHPEWQEGEREVLLRASYAELGILFLDLIRATYRFDRFVERHCDIEGGEHIRNALAEGKGVVVATAPLGNWEVLAASGYLFFGSKVELLGKPIRPAWMQRIAELIRALVRVRTAPWPNAMPEILRTLNRKEIVGMAIDSYAGAPLGIAVHEGARVVPAVAVRGKNGRYRLRFEAPLPFSPDPGETLQLYTQLLVKRSEEWGAEFPAQWLWIRSR